MHGLQAFYIPCLSQCPQSLGAFVLKLSKGISAQGDSFFDFRMHEALKGSLIAFSHGNILLEGYCKWGLTLSVTQGIVGFACSPDFSFLELYSGEQNGICVFFTLELAQA